jgi:hypothetical protein
VGHHIDFESEVGPRDRLGVALSSQPLFSARVRALLATGVLAFSFGAATVSVASETDTEQEGVSPQPSGPSDQVGDGSAEETPLPVEVVPVSPVPGNPEQQPSTDETGGDPQAGGPPTGAPPQAVAPTVVPGAQPAPVPEQAPPTAPAPVTPDSVPAPVPPLAPGGVGAGTVVEELGASTQTQHLRVSNSDQGRGAEGGHGAHGAPVAPETDQAPQPTPAAASQALPASRPAMLRPRQRFYVVRPGDSLWAIAVVLRGPDASIAAVRRVVRRLWRLNRNRIGTGDPDALPIGVRLRLRR